MKYKIVYLPVAKKDISNIVNYIADNLKAPKTAMELLDEFDKVIVMLQDFPYSHKVYQTIDILEKEHRLIPVKNYAIFYTVDDYKKTVEITRVTYAKMDLTKIIK